MSNKTGINFLIYVNTGTVAVPTYTLVAGQRGATLNRSRDTVELTNKTTGNGFKEFAGTFAEWSIDFDGLLVESDVALQHLEDAFYNNEEVLVRFETAAGNKYEGNTVFTDFPIEAPYDSEVTYSGTLQGSGAYTKTQAA
jgi:TP901-1 family phage major tail protein